MPCWKVFVGSTPIFKLEYRHFRNWIVACLILHMLLRPIELQSNHFRNWTGMYSKVYPEVWYLLNIITVLTSDISGIGVKSWVPHTLRQRQSTGHEITALLKLLVWDADRDVFCVILTNAAKNRWASAIVSFPIQSVLLPNASIIQAYIQANMPPKPPWCSWVILSERNRGWRWPIQIICLGPICWTTWGAMTPILALPGPLKGVFGPRVITSSGR